MFLAATSQQHQRPLRKVLLMWQLSPVLFHSSTFAQSLWRLLPPCLSLSTSQCAVPARCKGPASLAPVVWEGDPLSWRWWRVTSWWISLGGTSLSICSLHQTDCACTGSTATGCNKIKFFFISLLGLFLGSIFLVQSVQDVIFPSQKALPQSFI